MRSAKVLSSSTLASKDFARRVAEEPGALPTLVAALAVGCSAAATPSLQAAACDSACVLASITCASPDHVRRVVDEPGEVSALVAALAAGTAAAAPIRLQAAAGFSATVLMCVALAGPDLGRRLAEEQGALPALVPAVAAGGGAAEHSLQSAAQSSAAVLDDITKAGPDIARRVAEEPRALQALVAILAAGSTAAATPSLQKAA